MIWAGTELPIGVLSDTPSLRLASLGPLVQVYLEVSLVSIPTGVKWKETRLIEGEVGHDETQQNLSGCLLKSSDAFSRG